MKVTFYDEMTGEYYTVEVDNEDQKTEMENEYNNGY